MKKIFKYGLLIIGLLVITLIGKNATNVTAQAPSDPLHSIKTSNASDCSVTNINEYEVGDHLYIRLENSSPSTPESIPPTNYNWKVVWTNYAGSPKPVHDSGTENGVSVLPYCFDTGIVFGSGDIGKEFKATVYNDNVSKSDNFKIAGDVEPTPATMGYETDCNCVEYESHNTLTFTNLTGAAADLYKDSVYVNTYTAVDVGTHIPLDVGSVYYFIWYALPGFTGGDTVNLGTIGECCEPKLTPTVIIGTPVCEWTGEASVYHVSFTLEGVSLSITDGKTYGPFTTSGSVDLEPDMYNYDWITLFGYEFDEGGGSWDLSAGCEPGTASVSVEACVWDEQEGSSFIAHITVNNAALTIDGETYYTNDDVTLPAGYYTYTWVAIAPYTGSGSGSIDVEGCEPATVNVVVGVCDWIEMESLTPVTLTIHGALLDIYADDGGPTHKGQYGEGIHVVSLPPGSYYYTWTAVEDFTGAGRGEFETIDCEPGKADAAISIGACTYTDGQSLTLVTITISNATLTIDGQTFTEAAELKLLPGEYPYTWEAISEEYDGEGSGVLSVGACEPKEEEEPDVPAGGNGPSLIITLTPALLTVSGIAMAWILVKFRIKKI